MSAQTKLRRRRRRRRRPQDDARAHQIKITTLACGLVCRFAGARRRAERDSIWPRTRAHANLADETRRRSSAPSVGRSGDAAQDRRATSDASGADKRAQISASATIVSQYWRLRARCCLRLWRQTNHICNVDGAAKIGAERYSSARTATTTTATTTISSFGALGNSAAARAASAPIGGRPTPKVRPNWTQITDPKVEPLAHDKNILVAS